MPLEHLFEAPFRIHLSFQPFIKKIKETVKNEPSLMDRYQKLLEEIENKPELNDELDIPYLQENESFFKYLLSDLFPEYLSDNEIKAVSIPYLNFIFNPSRRFEKILKDAGEKYELKFRGFYSEHYYVMSCCIILNYYYKIPVKADFPLIYDIPNKDGYINHYRILSNADFIEIYPTEKAVNLSKQDIAELLDQYENIDLWKEKFPPNSWELRGFGIINMYDATTEIAISNLKSLLIQPKEDFVEIRNKMSAIFKSIYRISDLEIGYTAINTIENRFEESSINSAISSKILFNFTTSSIFESKNDQAFISFLENKKYFSISDVKKFFEENPNCSILSNLIEQNIQSAIFAPIYKNQLLLGVIEITSSQKLLNSINAAKMDTVLPFLSDSINMLYSNMENYILALIQLEYTTIHPSVYWKFHDEVKKHINFGSTQTISTQPYRSISFEELTPLYGQSDIKNSSKKRNEAIVLDLQSQLKTLYKLISSLKTTIETKEILNLIKDKEKELTQGLKANTENEFHGFLKKNIYPRLENYKFENIGNNKKITAYFQLLDNKDAVFNENRKIYEENISIINRELSGLLDKRTETLQQQFPFYYERFKTDGIEHTIYIGSSIAPWLTYHPVYLENLRLAQLRILIESNVLFQHLKNQHHFDMELTSLVLAYSTTLSIRFRMDEKRFDVDGSYNVRFEVIKKRIDKAFLKNSEERLVQPGKIVIVYSQDKEKTEYLNYIGILQKEGHLDQEIEILELENLQGIIGLKALRIKMNTKNTFEYSFCKFN